MSNSMRRECIRRVHLTSCGLREIGGSLGPVTHMLVIVNIGSVDSHLHLVMGCLAGGMA